MLDELESLPAVRAMLEEIDQTRRNRRPGYPPCVMFRAFAMKYMVNERFTCQFIERLRQSPRLRQICRFEQVPSESTFSRFFRTLSHHHDLIETAMTEVAERLREHLPDIGQSISIDSTDVEAYSNPKREFPTDPDAR